MRHNTHTLRGLFALCMLATGLAALVQDPPVEHSSVAGLVAVSLCDAAGDRLGAHAQARIPGDLSLLARRLRCPE